MYSTKITNLFLFDCNSGVCQGTNFDPLVFVIFINDVNEPGFQLFNNSYYMLMAL